MRHALRAALLLGSACLAAAAAAPPDLTGIWTMDALGRGGTSVGRFEGDTLVVETTGLTESVDQPTAHGADARIVERYTPSVRDGLRRLRVEVTIHDPEFYTSPPTLVREYTQLVGSGMLDYSCPEPLWEEHLETLRQQQRSRR